MPVGDSLRSREATTAGEVELFVVAFELVCSLFSSGCHGNGARQFFYLGKKTA